jgi:hypothetical protein
MKHPVSDRRLRKWLAEDSPQLEQYLERFPDETDRVDALTALGSDTRDQIDEMYVPPTFAVDAIKARIAAQRDLSPTALLTDLVAGAFTTASILFTDDQETTQ